MKIGGGTEATTAHVYRLFDAAEAILYVGCSTRPADRIARHRSTSPFHSEIARWEVDDALSVRDALVDERRQILELNPIHNKLRPPVPNEGEDFAHGKTGYTRHGCRCAVCTSAQTAYIREYRQTSIGRSKARRASTLTQVRGKLAARWVEENHPEAWALICAESSMEVSA
jgi:hypothetical protein